MVVKPVVGNRRGATIWGGAGRGGRNLLGLWYVSSSLELIQTSMLTIKIRDEAYRKVKQVPSYG